MQPNPVTYEDLFIQVCSDEKSNFTYEGLLFIQVRSDAKAMHCSTFLGKQKPPLLNAALQNRLTAAF